MTFRLLYSLAAEQDLLDIFDYIQMDNPPVAASLLGLMEKSILRLRSLPRSGLLPRDHTLQAKGYRILIVKEYLIFYRLEQQIVRIQRVLHGRRRYEFLVSERS